ncbi:MAG TPA: hypothetical protein PK096_03290 [Candidatus Saccharibacteria bacterium]|nr:hypothetical protein [Candidatus Saccharibacteria bacterium]HRK94367.1 hypothetical protein [Candidatus Saccharibacteria bacterium]
MNEKQSFNQINEQVSSAYMNQSGDNPTVLIRRTSGNITVGRLDTDTRKVHFSENGEKWEKQVALENLSDAKQEQLATELAGRALRGVAETESEPSVDPLEALDESVRAEVLLYRRAVQNKLNAEREKNFALAAEDGRAIYRVEQSLSPAAKAFLNLT